jgi:hypothetical protein
VSLHGLLEVLLADTAWHEDAACRPSGQNLSELFLPVQEPGYRRWTGEERAEARQRIAEALRICQDCKVRRQCAAYAARNKIRFGVWGGQVLGLSSTSKRPPAFKPLRRSA